MGPRPPPLFFRHVGTTTPPTKISRRPPIRRRRTRSAIRGTRRPLLRLTSRQTLTRATKGQRRRRNSAWGVVPPSTSSNKPRRRNEARQRSSGGRGRDEFQGWRGKMTAKGGGASCGIPPRGSRVGPPRPELSWAQRRPRICDPRSADELNIAPGHDKNERGGGQPRTSKGGASRRTKGGSSINKKKT